MRFVRDFLLIGFKKTVRAVRSFEFESGVVFWRNAFWRCWARSGGAGKVEAEKRGSMRTMRGARWGERGEAIVSLVGEKRLDLFRRVVVGMRVGMNGWQWREEV